MRAVSDSFSRDCFFMVIVFHKGGLHSSGFHGSEFIRVAFCQKFHYIDHGRQKELTALNCRDNGLIKCSFLQSKVPVGQSTLPNFTWATSI